MCTTLFFAPHFHRFAHGTLLPQLSQFTQPIAHCIFSFGFILHPTGKPQDTLRAPSQTMLFPLHSDSHCLPTLHSSNIHRKLPTRGSSDRNEHTSCLSVPCFQKNSPQKPCSRIADRVQPPYQSALTFVNPRLVKYTIASAFVIFLWHSIWEILLLVWSSRSNQQ